MRTFTESVLHEAASKSLSRVLQHTQESNVGIITAYRGEFDKKANEARNAKLAQEIRSNGFGYFTVTGFYIENLGKEDETKVQEKSFFITSSPSDAGKLKKFLVSMGKKYNQDSVFYKDVESAEGTLIGTASGRWPGLGTEVNVGKFNAQRLGAFYTKMKGNRTFTFESFDFQENIMSRGYRELLAKKSM